MHSRWGKIWRNCIWWRIIRPIRLIVLGICIVYMYICFGKSGLIHFSDSVQDLCWSCLTLFFLKSFRHLKFERNILKVRLIIFVVRIDNDYNTKFNVGQCSREGWQFIWKINIRWITELMDISWGSKRKIFNWCALAPPVFASSNEALLIFMCIFPTAWHLEVLYLSRSS